MTKPTRLDDLAKFPSISRKAWDLKDEPTHLDKGLYYKTIDEFTRLPIWEESDESMRIRIKEFLP